MAGIVELIAKMDNRSAIRAMRQITEQSNKTARGMQDDSRKSTTSLDQVGRSTHRLRGAVSSLAGTVGLAGLAFGFKDVINKGMEWQSQQAALQQALRNTGLYSQQTAKALQNAAEKGAVSGGFGASSELQAITQYVAQTHSATQATKLNTAAMNLARGAHIDYTAAVRMLGQAVTGQPGRLQKYLGIIQPVKTAEYALAQAHKLNTYQLEAQAKAMGKAGPAWLKQQELLHGITPQMKQHAQLLDRIATSTKIVSIVQSHYGGQTAAFSKTTAGQLSNLRNQVDILAKNMGQNLLPVVTKVVRVLSKLFGWLNKNRAVLYILLGAVVAVSAVLAIHTAIVEVANAKNYLLLASNRLLGTSFVVEGAEAEAGAGGMAILGAAMDALPVLALIAGLVLLVTHFKLVKKIAVDAFHWILNAAKDVWGWLTHTWTHLPVVLQVIISPLLTIITHFGAVKKAAKSVWNWLKGAWHTLKDVLTWPFREAWKVISGIFHKITSIPGAIGHAAGGLLHTLSFGLFDKGGVVPGPAGRARPIVAHGREGILTAAATSMIGGEQAVNALNRGQVPEGLQSESGGQFTVTVQQPWVIRLDSRALAQGVLQYTLRKAARGPSSLSGGALVTGVAGTH